ncbi:unnamed protein product, partial [Closterium sp. NIES-53]
MASRMVGYGRGGGGSTDESRVSDDGGAGRGRGRDSGDIAGGGRGSRRENRHPQVQQQPRYQSQRSPGQQAYQQSTVDINSADSARGSRSGNGGFSRPGGGGYQVSAAEGGAGRVSGGGRFPRIAEQSEGSARSDAGSTATSYPGTTNTSRTSSGSASGSAGSGSASGERKGMLVVGFFGPNDSELTALLNHLLQYPAFSSPSTESASDAPGEAYSGYVAGGGGDCGGGEGKENVFGAATWRRLGLLRGMLEQFYDRQQNL